MNEELNLIQEWDKVFPLSEQVNHKKVTFKNHFGITLVADMYEPKGAEGKLAAIAVCGPFGAVKEQSSGLYAMKMAERGFLAIAFDPSFTGESAGEPRRIFSVDNRKLLDVLSEGYGPFYYVEDIYFIEFEKMVICFMVGNDE